MVSAQVQIAENALAEAIVLLRPISDAIFNAHAGGKRAEREEMGRKINSALTKIRTAQLALEKL